MFLRLFCALMLALTPIIFIVFVFWVRVCVGLAIKSSRTNLILKSQQKVMVQGFYWCNAWLMLPFCSSVFLGFLAFNISHSCLSHRSRHTATKCSPGNKLLSFSSLARRRRTDIHFWIALIIGQPPIIYGLRICDRFSFDTYNDKR